MLHRKITTGTALPSCGVEFHHVGSSFGISISHTCSCKLGGYSQKLQNFKRVVVQQGARGLRHGAHGVGMMDARRIFYAMMF